jgi:hypothetical protein
MDTLVHQLAMRTASQQEWETVDPECSHLAAFVARTIKEEFGWPNDHFIPDDPFDLMLFGDEGTGVEVLNAIEDYLELPRGLISDEQLEQYCRLTFGEVVTQLLSCSMGNR